MEAAGAMSRRMKILFKNNYLDFPVLFEEKVNSILGEYYRDTLEICFR